MLGLHL